jgi:hypothetical protein
MSAGNAPTLSQIASDATISPGPGPLGQGGGVIIVPGGAAAGSPAREGSAQEAFIESICAQASESRIREHTDNSAGTGTARVAGPSHGGGSPGAIAAEVAACEPVWDVHPEHARAPTTRAGGIVHWRDFAEIWGFARLRPCRRG